MLLDDDVEPIVLTLKAEAGECRDSELRSHDGDQGASRLGLHKQLEEFKLRN
jgi:hypothetical protein